MKRLNALPIIFALLGGLLVLACVFNLLQAPPASAAPLEQKSSGGLVCFVANSSTQCVDRPGLQAGGTLTDQVRSLIESMLSGPAIFESAAGIASALPDHSALIDLAVTPDRVIIDLDLPADYLDGLNADQVEAANEQFIITLTPYNFKRVEVNARAADGTLRLLSSFLKPIAIPHKAGAGSASRLPLGSQPPVGGQPQPHGGLYGKTVFVSAGHGWFYNATAGSYYTQRATYPDYTLAGCSSAYGKGIVEDFNNAEAVNQFLLQYLWNAGADAWTVRERDMNTSMLIVDDSQAAFTTQGTWSTGAAGYANSYHSATTVSAAATATATWTFTPPSTGTYAVYVWYPYPGGVIRTADAHYFIDHAGATTPVTITQTRDDSNWRFLGQYPFYGGQPAHIRLNNQSQISDLTVIADAIRIGGGIGDVSVAGAPASGKPRWEEQSRQYAKWVGMPDVDNLNDVIVRPIYSEWEKEKDPGEDSVYVAWHTNGFNGCTSASGTESYVYLWPTVGSTLLQYSIHTALLNGLKTQWDPNWIDRGLKSADFGELRLLNSMPGVLLENGFHDNLNDERAQRDPKFNLISARAIYHGLVAYWNATQPGNVPLIFLPEAPTHLIVRNDGTGRVIATWQPGPIDNTGTLGGAATAYRVYTSTDGFGWNDGLRTTQLIYTFTNLLPNQLIYVRVTGVNAGGESFPTPVLAARLSTSGLAPVLLVYANDRIDYSQLIQQSDGPDGLNRRMFLNRINRYDYIIQHAEVITLPFDSAQHGSVTDGSIGLGNYWIVDWIAGEDQSPDTALKSSDQTALTNFMNGGGSLFMSGSEIGYDLTNLGATPFYNQVLHAAFVADNGDTTHAYTVNAQPGSLFEGQGSITFDNSTHGTYNVNYPDSFTPIALATSALVYNGGDSAGLQYDSGSCARLVYLGVPFETIYPAAMRQTLMARVMGYLGKCVVQPVDTVIDSPVDGLITHTLPSFYGGASSNANYVQVSIKDVVHSTFYNGAIFNGTTEVWLTAAGASSWFYPLPNLADGVYALRARSLVSSTLLDASPASVTFTLDTIAPLTPILITPTGGITILAVAPTFSWSSGGNPNRFEINLDNVATMLNSPATTAQLSVLPGAHQWRVRALDAANNVSAWTDLAQFQTEALKAYLPLVLDNYTPPPPPPGQLNCSNVIQNGDFETGNLLPEWVSLSQNPVPGIVNSNVYSGSYAARVGAPIATSVITGYSSIQQSIAIPANAVTATLSYAYYSYSVGPVGDLQYGMILDQNNLLLDYFLYTRSDAEVWQTFSTDLLKYAGQIINVRFGVRTTGGIALTGMLVDDVELRLCTP